MGKKDEALGYWRRLADVLPEHATRGKFARERVAALSGGTSSQGQ